MATPILIQAPPSGNLPTPVKKFPQLRQLWQLRRHDPATAEAAERLLAAGFPDAAAHRIRQGMHQLLDRFIAERQAEQAEVQNVTPQTKRRRYTRRQFLITAASAGSLALVGQPVESSADEVARSGHSTPPASAPRPSDGHVLNVETHASVPNRADIVDPATLADYVQKMEAHLNEYAHRIQDWAADGDIPLREFLENEAYALLDSLAAFIVAAEKVGVGEVVAEILTIDDTLNYAECSQPHQLPDPEKTGFHYIRDYLWGEKPPVMSRALQSFAVLKTVMGEGAARQIRAEAGHA